MSIKLNNHRRYKSLGVVLPSGFMVLTLIFFLGFIKPINISAEGTKEIMPYDTCLSRLNLEPSFTNFAMFNCAPHERLNIHIANVGEKIFYGFGKIFDAGQLQQFDLYYRIKDPNGAIVVIATLIPSSGTGYIPSYNKAVAGPNIISTTGYSPLSYTATSIGDYYIEFFYNYTAMGDRREIQYYDITVTTANNQKIDGRTWSKEWQFTVTASPQPNPYDNPFYGELYIYSDDSIVTSVDFNGLKPYVFAVTANSTGTANTGNIIQDRKSKAGKNTYPQYKIFLNDPDSIVYPSGTLGGFNAPLTFTGCPGNHCINVSTSKAGAIQLLIDLNGIPGYQIATADLLIVQNVNAGITCIPWNGIDGLGIPVPDGTVVKFKVVFVSGLTHMPIYDAEHNPNGYIIGLIRPISSTTTFSLYWDDSNFPGAITPPSAGCNSANGCHVFNNMFGDQRTINTWWYAASNLEDSLTITYSRIAIDSILTINASCPNISDGSAQIIVSGGTLPYTFSINGGALQTSYLFPSLAVGNYTATVADSNNCSITDTFSIFSSPNLLANTLTTNDTCNAGNGTIAVNITTGSGPYQYLWNTNPPTTTSSLSSLLTGTYTVSITDSHNCVFIFSDSIFNIPSNIQINSTILHDTCTNSMGQIILSITNSQPPLTYNWNTNPVQNTSIATNLGAGLYWVTITENAVCHSILSFNLNDMPPPSPNFLLPDKGCIGDTINIQYQGNQTPPDNFSWTFGLANTISGFGLGPFSVNYLQTGKHYISLNVSKLGCPSSFYTDSIELFELIAMVDSFKNVDCFGGNNGFIGIDFSGGVLPYSFNWNPGGIGSSSNNQLSAGLFNILITDSIGCKANISQQISEPPAISIQLTAEDVSCSYLCDGSIISNVSGGSQPYIYNWTPGVMPSISSLNNLCKGVYTLRLTDNKLCEDSAKVTIGVRTQINADFTYYSRTNFTERNIVDFTFTGFGASSFYWDFGDFQNSSLRDPSHYYQLDTTYWVELIINSGAPDYCKDTSLQLINVLPPFNIFVPNAFSPNGNGINDKFMVIGTRIKSYQIYIYNRWGKLIYESIDIFDGWDGYYLGQEAPQDVYSYIIKVIGEDDKPYERVGTIVLIK